MPRIHVKKKRRVKAHCIHCKHPTGQGNSHGLNSCPPKKKPGDNRRARQGRKASRRRALAAERIQRGMPVAGTGKGAGEASA